MVYKELQTPESEVPSAGADSPPGSGQLPLGCHSPDVLTAVLGIV